MSQAEDLLNSLGETLTEHTHEVPDSDTHFLINPNTRQIENTNYQKTVLMRGDHNSERFTFEIPRYVDGHDMSLCNRVIVHFDNVGEKSYDVYSDVVYMNDLRINPDKPDTVISSWLIRREATQIVGLLSFSLQYQCVENDEITYEWNTDVFDKIEIRESKNNGEAAVIQYTNVLEQWRSQIFGAGDSVMSNITSEGATQVAAVKSESAAQQAAIELKGSETLATIPDEYTEVYNMANEAMRTKADSVVCEAEGSAITVVDSSEDHIRGLTVYGKSTQFITTGKNKLNLGQLSERVVNGITITPVYDGNGNLSYLNINGTSSGTFIVLAVPFHITAGTYTFTNFLNRTTEDRTLHAQICDSSGGLLYPQDAGLGGNFTFDNDVDLLYRIYVQEGRVVNNEKLYPMLRNSTITDDTYEPYTGGIASPNPDYPQEIVSIENPIVSVYGSNLLTDYTDYKMTQRGITCEFEGDGIYHIYGTFNGTTPSLQFADIALNIPVDPNANYTLSCELVEGIPPDDFHPYVGLKSDTVSHRNWIAINVDSKNRPGDIINNTMTPASALNKPTHINRFWIYAHNDTLESYIADFRIRVWLTKSDVPMSYKPYTRQMVTLTNTLHGIPVTTGGNYIPGNYTDENGQEWICDEVDLDRGVYVQRVGRLVLDGNSDWNLYNYQTQYYGFHIWDALDEQHQRSPGLCNQFKTVGGSSKDCLWVGVTNKNIYAISKEWYDKGLDAWKAHLNEKPLDIIYARVTPIETPLTAEEIVAFKSLKTKYLTTNFVNNSGAWMGVKYNADIKKYTEIYKQKLIEDVTDRFRDNVTPARIGTVTLLASAWVGSNNLHSQVVSIDGVTENSQVDLTPNIEQLAVFYDKDLSFVTENDGGVVTVYAIGQKPTNDYTIQVTITEVEL